MLQISKIIFFPLNIYSQKYKYVIHDRPSDVHI
jgi:hypothetical protein